VRELDEALRHYLQVRRQQRRLGPVTKFNARQMSPTPVNAPGLCKDNPAWELQHD